MSTSDDIPVDPALDPDIMPPETRIRVGELVDVEEQVAPGEDPEPERLEFTDEERRDLSMLLNVGRRVKTIDVIGHKVTIRTLKSSDEMRVGLYTKDYLDSHAFARAHQVGICAAGIVEVDGLPVFQSLKEKMGEDEIFAKTAEILADYYPVVISAIYNGIRDLEREFAQLLEKLNSLGKTPG